MSDEIAELIGSAEDEEQARALLETLAESSAVDDEPLEEAGEEA